MTKSEDKPSAPTKILKTSTCKTLSGKSDSSVHLHISKNTGGGFFSTEWIALKDIQDVLEGRPEGEPGEGWGLQVGAQIHVTFISGNDGGPGTTD